MSLLNDAEAMAANAILPGSGILVKLWGWVKPFLPWIMLALGVLACLWAIERHGEAVQKARDDVVIAARDKTIADLKAASKQAKATNKAQVQTQETAQADHTKDANHDDQIRKIAADDAVDRYISLHHATGGGASGAGTLPAQPDATSRGDDAPSPTDVHEGDADSTLVLVPAGDLRICKEWVLKGQSFDAWWPGAAKIIDDAADKAENVVAAEPQ